MHQDKDRISSWLLTNYLKSILYLAGYRNVNNVRPARTQVVAPRTFPDGLFELEIEGFDVPLLVLIEIETYAANDIGQQLRDDLMLVWLERGILPEAVVLVMAPKGHVTAPSQNRIQSRGGTSALTTSWRTIEIWRLSAEEMLNHPDVGMVPWATLMEYNGTEEELLTRVRDRIHSAPDEEYRKGLLESTVIFAGVNYSHLDLLQLLRGTLMIKERDLPAFKKLYDRIDEIEQEKKDIAEQARLSTEQAEATRKSLLDTVRVVLDNRFPAISTSIIETLKEATNERLNQVVTAAMLSTDETDFLNRLTSE